MEVPRLSLSAHNFNVCPLNPLNGAEREIALCRLFGNNFRYKNNSGNNRHRVGRGNARIAHTRERQAVGVTSPSFIKQSGI